MVARFSFEKFQKRNTRIVLGISFLVFLLFTYRFAISVSADLQSYYHHGATFFIWTIAFLAFYSYFVNEVEIQLKNNIVVKYVEWLGRNVTLTYFLQWIIIGNIATTIFKTMSSPAQLVFSFIGVLFAVSIACALILKAKKILKGSAKAF
jgi:hypothetical protein